MTDNPKVVALKKLIASSIAKDPHELDGFVWCKMSHEARWKALGISRSTFLRMIGNPPGKPPFVSKTRVVDGIRTTLLRVGEPGPKTDHDYACMMVAVWRKWLTKNLPQHRAELEARKLKLGEVLQKTSDLDAREAALAKLARVDNALRRMRQARETPNEFGLFIGLAKAWPDGVQIDIFKRVLDDLQRFMMGVRLKQHQDEAKGKPTLKPRFLRFPHIKTVLEYYEVALEMMQDYYQETCIEPPEAFKALNPPLWKGWQTAWKTGKSKP